MNTKMTITKNNLASIILLYNYLINNQHSISKSVVDIFYQMYENNFNNLYEDKYNFIDEEIIESDFAKKNISIPNILHNYYFRNHSFRSPNKIRESDYLGIKIDNQYYITDLNAVMLNYRSLPIEIVDYSLNNEVLKNINLQLNKLKQDTCIKEYAKYLDVYSLNKEFALELAKNKINDYGYYDVNINSIDYSNKNSHNYRIAYDAKRELKRVNVHQMVLKR